MEKVITFGEVMLRLATPGYERFGQSNTLVSTFGGGEANVAVSLANYNIPVSFVTRLPKNDIVESCIRELRGFGVDTGNIIYGGDRMGVYYLETGAVSRGSKVIYDRDHSAIAEIEPGMIDWDEVFKEATWFHWTGITPAISKGAAEALAEAIASAKKKNITISCDLNYRKKLWNWGKTAQEVMPEFVKDCDIILGNEEDAEKALNIKPEGIDVTSGEIDNSAYLSVMQQIKEKYPNCKYVITTLRGSISANHNSWSGVLYDGNQMFEAPTYQITHIVDRVGGGDSFMGGLIYGLITYQEDIQKALNFAVAASCLKHTIYGDYNRVTVDEVEKLMQGDASGRVSR